MTKLNKATASKNLDVESKQKLKATLDKYIDLSDDYRAQIKEQNSLISDLKKAYLAADSSDTKTRTEIKNKIIETANKSVELQKKLKDSDSNINEYNKKLLKLSKV